MRPLFKQLALALAMGVASVAPASAALVFDDFTAVQTANDDTTNGVGVFGPQVSGGTIFGGHREVFAFKAGNAGASDLAGARVSTAVFGGRARFSADDDTYGYGVIRWDGVEQSGVATNLLTNSFGADTTGAVYNLNNFGVGFDVTYNSDHAFDIAILIYTANGIFVAGQPVSDTNDLDVTDQVLFSEFVSILDLTTPATAADLAGTQAVEVIFNGLSVNLGRLDMNFAPPTAIPEPGSIALAGLALLAAGAARRRKK